MKKLLYILPFLFISSHPKENFQEATGNLIATPENFEILTFADVKIFQENSKDTFYYNSEATGIFTYTLPTKDKTKYQAIISPGKDPKNDAPGDQFKPYKSEFSITPGKNELIKLKRKNLETEL